MEQENRFGYPLEKNEIKDEKNRQDSDADLILEGADIKTEGDNRKIIATPEQKHYAKKEMETALDFRQSIEKRAELAQFLNSLGYTTEASPNIFKVTLGSANDKTEILHVREPKPAWYNKGKKKWVAKVNFGHGTIETDSSNMQNAMQLADEIEKHFRIHFNVKNVIDSPEVKAQIHEEADKYL